MEYDEKSYTKPTVKGTVSKEIFPNLDWAIAHDKSMSTFKIEVEEQGIKMLAVHNEMHGINETGYGIHFKYRNIVWDSIYNGISITLWRKTVTGHYLNDS